MKLKFDTFGNEKQKEACIAWNDKTTNELYYGGAKGGGKSFLGVELIFGDAFTYPGIHCFIARKELTDLVKHTIPSIYEVFALWGITKEYYNYNGQTNIFTLYNGSKVFLLYAKELPSDPLYERFGSMQMTEGWIEEGGEFVENAYKNLKISIGRWKNDVYKIKPRLLTTLNPKKNYIYSNVYKPFKNNNLPENIKFIQALITDNKRLPKEYIENLYNTLTGTARQRLLFGEWEYDDDPNWLIDSYDAVLDLFKNHHVVKGLKYIVCDAARFGSDKAVIIVFDGLRAVEKYVFEISKTTDISKKIIELQKKYRVSNRQTIVDADGVGGGVADEVDCISFNNNKAPINVKIDGTKQIGNIQYSNLKSQCAFKLAEIINKSEMYIEFSTSETEKAEIIQDFECLKRKDDDDKMGLISKDLMKQSIGRSPDWLDTFIMRMYFEISVKKPIISGW